MRHVRHSRCWQARPWRNRSPSYPLPLCYEAPRNACIDCPNFPKSCRRGPYPARTVPLTNRRPTSGSATCENCPIARRPQPRTWPSEAAPRENRSAARQPCPSPQLRKPYPARTVPLSDGCAPKPCRCRPCPARTGSLPEPAVAGRHLREPAIAQQSRPIIAHVGPWTNTMTRQWEKLSTSEKVGFSRFFSFRHANRPFSDHRTKKHHPHKPNDLSSLS